MGSPSIRQLEKYIRRMALDSFNVAITSHAASRMKQRRINRPMVFEVLQKGVLRCQSQTSSTAA